MERVLSTLLARFDVVEEERGEYYVPCVVHDDEAPSLAFRLKEDGRLLINCWAGCSTTEILTELGMSRRDLSGWVPGEGVKASAKAEPSAVAPGDQAALAVYVDYTTGAFPLSHAREYVAERFGLGEEHAETLSLGFDAPGMGATFAHRSPAYEKYPRLTVPLMDFQGIPRGLQGRDLSGSCPARWLSITNPDGAAWARWGYFKGSGYRDEVLITEGPGDALTAVGAGFDAVAIRGAGVAKHEGAMDEIAAGVGTRPVYVVGDADEAGEKFTETVTRALQTRGVKVHVVSVPTAGDDLTDWRGRNPDAFGEEIDQAIDCATRPGPAPAPAPEPTTVKETKTVTEPLPLTDLGNAERLFRQLGGHVRRVEGADVFKWVGTHWVQIPVEALYADVRAVIDTLMDEPGHDREKLAKHWAASQDARRVRAMVDMLSSIPGVYARVDQFDAKPHLLAFSNGVVDLRTGTLREHRPDDMNTFCLDVAYNPNAHAPRWEKFLGECHPNSPDMPDFLRMLTGYGITGEGSERTFILHVGPTTNGKTTFTGALEETFGAATKRADASLFQKRANAGGPRADIVGLRGSRLVISSEWPANMPLDQALMKAVTGDQSITARGVYARTEITFKPTCLVQVDSNYPPDVDATDAALWQRVRVVPWLEDFRGREDKHLSATLRKEKEGIAAWAVRGAVEWYAANKAGGGLVVPDAVDKATSRYRVASHPLAGFTAGTDSEGVLDAEFVEDAEGFVPRSLVWARYQAWAEECGIKHTMTRNKLYDTVRTISGVVEGQGTGANKGVRGFKGLRDAKAAPAPTAPSSAPEPAPAASPAPSPGPAKTDLFGQAR